MKNKFALLSYPISAGSPVYGGKSAVGMKFVKQLRKGDSCNSFEFRLSSHSGTHVNAPRHFYNSGRPIGDYKIDELVFNKPFVLDCYKEDDQLIEENDLLGIGRCDILLIRTGFFKFRRQKKYIFHNPGFSEKAAKFLCKNYPFIKAIGLDSISVSGYQHRQEGCRSHKILLGQGKGILLIEDMDLSANLNNISRVFVVPLFCKGIDSSPVTVIAELSVGS